MKIADLILNSNKKKNHKSSAIVMSLEKVKYPELAQLIPLIDSAETLSNYSLGWNALHYASVNPNPLVLRDIIELYNKHHVSLDMPIRNTKKQVPENGTAMDIAITLKLFKNFFILKNYGANQNHEVYYHNFDIHGKPPGDFHLPFPQNPINLFWHSYDLSMVSQLLTWDYEEKSQYLDEFMANHRAICAQGPSSISKKGTAIYEKYMSDLFNMATKINEKAEITPGIFPFLEFFLEPIYQAIQAGKMELVLKENQIYGSLNTFFRFYNKDNVELRDMDNYKLVFRHVASELTPENREKLIFIGNAFKEVAQPLSKFACGFLLMVEELMLFEQLQDSLPSEKKQTRTLKI